MLHVFHLFWHESGSVYQPSMVELNLDSLAFAAETFSEKNNDVCQRAYVRKGGENERT